MRDGGGRLRRGERFRLELSCSPRLGFAWFFLAAVAAFSPAIALGAGVGFVAGAKGEARIVRGEASLPAAIGSEVLERDTLRTGPGGRLRVLLSDDSVLSLGANSELRIVEHLFQEGQRRTRLDLSGGLVRSLVQKMVSGRPADFEVRTGNVVSGVRGTEFVIQRMDGGARIAVLSGEVEYLSDGGTRALLAAGFGCDVGGPASASPVALADAEIRSLKESTDAESSPEALASAAPLSREVLEEGSFLPARERAPEQEPFRSEAMQPGNNRVGFGGDAGTDFELGQMFGQTGPQPGHKTGDVSVTITLRPR
ncbi:MAG: FecR domain-containing protein [Myxococcales bacterium]|nr:FecR domain-containing protein [Myxococcales bacterium]